MFNQREKNESVYYVRWGGIPSWDVKEKTLKKAKTWGMGAGVSCLTSLHENKIREIIASAINEHNGKSLGVIKPNDIERLQERIVKYQIARQRILPSKEQSLRWTAPTDWTPLMGLIADIANSDIDQMLASMKKSGIIPFFHTEDEHQKFYYDYCNKRLWPLLHRHLGTDTEQKDDKPRVKDIFEVAPCNKAAFDEYVKINREAARNLAKNVDEDAVVWLHDYHLCLIPSFLKEMRPDIKLGYHFHSPVPLEKLLIPLDEDIKRLITSLMQCNYISFNTQRDLDNFKEIVLGLGLSTEHVAFEANPIGVEPVQTLADSKQPLIQKTIEEIISLRKQSESSETKLNNPSSGMHVIFSVDRIEPSKGLRTRLKAIQDLLEGETPDLAAANKLLFVMVCPDSRTGIEAYERLNRWFKEEIRQLNALSNEKIGRDIIKFHGEMTQSELQALGQHANTFLVTSDVDGLHLGPVEWLATGIHHDKDKSVNVIVSTGAGVSEYFPHAMQFKSGDHRGLSTLFRDTITESRDVQEHRSNAIKQDFQGGAAQGFRLDKWGERGVKGIVTQFLKDHNQGSQLTH